jgi:hypothetical protein
MRGWASPTASDIDRTGRIKPGAPNDQLYNLANDLTQKKNLTLDHPERSKAMRARLEELVPKRKPSQPSASP